MPFLFILVGIVMVTSAGLGTTGDLAALVKGDFTGKNNFLYWLAAIGILGGLGYIGPLRTPSRYFMALVLLVLILKNGGVFQNAVAALNAEAGTVSPSNVFNENAGHVSASDILTAAQNQNDLPGPTDPILNTLIQ